MEGQNCSIWRNICTGVTVPPVPHGLAWNRSRFFLVSTRRQKSWAGTRPVRYSKAY